MWATYDSLTSCNYHCPPKNISFQFAGVLHRNRYLETMASLQDRFLTYQPPSTPSISAIGSDSVVSHAVAASSVVGGPCVGDATGASDVTGASNVTSSASTSQVTLPLVPSVVQSRPVIRVFQSFHWIMIYTIQH